MSSELNEQARREMIITAGWIKFFAIFSFIMAILIMVGGSFFLNNVPSLYQERVIVFYVFMSIAVILSFIVGYLLLQYANKLKIASETGDLNQLEQGFKYYQIFFILWGVFVILSAINTVYELTKL